MDNRSEQTREYAGEYVEVVAVRDDTTAPGAATTAVRLLGLLPSHWSCAPRVEQDRVRLLIRLEGTGGHAAIRGTVHRVLADRALRGWHAEG
ncbi:hypothetical protein V1L54_20520 [Streptomyces sp. TRM 70361]|uniref:Uncharacterized protein n=1 Tax=Streptomyces carminius TaxID=2665496 RepID=A0A2M8LY34_9ACTN|nr:MULTISPECIES: hypothetical protein [Streptomyces]MEE1941757.1 hypothetical protein [Streptomyces sp. TRM 70361]PJE96839.1 hypothetical protein CUT44_15855 [Streptomyces carminius]